ncbi:MAG: sortase [Oscillospiraceae bacterium]|nr:sortase [Oscillospiraceae bacterium]
MKIKSLIFLVALILCISAVFLAPVTTASGLFPVSIQESRESGRREIVRAYELNEGENPAHISRATFDRDGFQFELTELSRREVPNYRTRQYVKTVTIYTQSNDFQTVLRELATEMYFEIDGYYGILALDISSINIQSRGTRSSQQTITRTREFPHLSAPDTSLIPRSITEGNQNFNLYNVEWRTQTTATVEYVQLPASFTAVATYRGTQTRTYNIGFSATAVYRGTLTHTTVGIQYTVRFTGVRIVNWRLFVGMLIFFLCIIGAYFVGKKYKPGKSGKIKTFACVGFLMCSLAVMSQTANAAPGIPGNSFGRGQQAIHLNPQTVSAAPSNMHVIGTPNIGNFAHTYTCGQRIGRLTVERLGRTINVYGGATMWAMDRGAGHFSFTGLNHGNTSLVGHNRGWNGFFSFVRLLREGDIIALYANGITRRYAVQRVFTVNETDFSPLIQFGDNRLTLVTCVEYQRNLRRVAVAIEIQ